MEIASQTTLTVAATIFALDVSLTKRCNAIAYFNCLHNLPAPHQATEDAQHPFAAEAHGLTDTLDRVVAADERDFRGDIAPGGSL